MSLARRIEGIFITCNERMRISPSSCKVYYILFSDRQTLKSCLYMVLLVCGPIEYFFEKAYLGNRRECYIIVKI